MRSLGESLLGVAGAELAAVKGDIRASARQVGIAALLALAAAFLFFWVVGGVGFVLFQVLTLWLPGWGAALIVLAIFLLVASILAWAARARLRAVEPPADTVRKRFDDHVAWWQGEVMGESARSPERLPERTSEVVAETGDES